jgi:hypothetical protein
MSVAVSARTRTATTPRKNRRAAAPAAAPPDPRSIRLSALAACSLPFFLALGLASFGLFEPVRHRPRLLLSFGAAAAALLVWTIVLFTSSVARRRSFTLETSLRKQHYLQACAQASVFLYWGWYWPEVYQSAPLLAAQLVFAYATEILLIWSRRDVYTVGFGLFPVVFSINLFLWFKPEWFYLQFLMVAAGIAGKELIRWDRDRRRVHIFNPSAFTLALFSIGLLATGTSGITWGENIAVTQFYPPHMYTMLFLIGLPGQLLFGVSPMTMAAAVTTYLFGLVYVAHTGIYFFYDSYIPIAFFLGMILLFTDPSTSPRTELGRLMFGALYGLSAVVLYDLLWRAGLPTFYDKLLQVPLLNLSVTGIDRVARSKAFRRFDPALIGRSLAPRQRNVAYVAVWAIAFAVMSTEQGVGDLHPGQWLPFWQHACGQQRPGACEFLLNRESSHCDSGSGWACNEAGILRLNLLKADENRVGREVDETIGNLDAPALAGMSRIVRQLAVRRAVGTLDRGCQLGFERACENLRRVTASAGPPESAPPTLSDYPIVLRGSKQPVTERTPSALYALACQEGWPDVCGLR